MTTEGTNVSTRAKRHAALADPARLRIVDLLEFSDMSPTEIQTTLQVSSNLLAHHINVLEDAGLVARSRSEADRRRSYVRLVQRALDDLVPARIAEAGRVVFVCSANSARSQIAEALWRQRSDIPAASAGTRPAPTINPGAIDVAKRHGLSLDGKPKATLDVLRADDFLITVCDVAHEEIPGQVRAHWSIPDPVRVGSREAFLVAYDEISRRVDQLAPRLISA